MRKPLVLLVAGVAALVAITSPQVRAQSAAKPLAFEVASVKANKSETDPGVTSDTTPGRFTVSNTPLLFIIHYAYNLLGYQLVGAPDWTWDDRFNVAATYTPASVPVDQQNVRAMVQKLLADRFGFVAHREQREVPMYALVLARTDGRLGSQLRRSDVDCEKWLAEKKPQHDAGGPSAVSPTGNRPACLMDVYRRTLSGGTRTMGDLAVSLGALTGRPVVDRTGLAGAFDMDLKWTTSGDVAVPPGVSAAGPDEAASIFTALQEQLGLKLEPTRGPFDVLVVDHVEHPTAD